MKNNKSKIFKYVRPIIYGVSLYLLITNLPILILKVNGINLQLNKQIQVDNEPIYKNKNGKVVNVNEYNEEKGYEIAKNENINSHVICKERYSENKDIFIKSGCDKYVTEHKLTAKHIKQGNWNSGKTTQQCMDEVYAYWLPLIEDNKELGIKSRSYDYGMELDECQNYDNVRIGKTVYEPTYRLQELIRKLKAKEKLSLEEKDEVVKDAELVKTFPENEHTQRYFRLLDEFYILAARSQK